ncbi:MAG TPA: hypothetical protein PKC39_04130 [Ferruginibacter sp.]|nr:hypothetical protein [Ferruginibacter sp.]HMP20128.1 hypothetical protein [Ferruginibacter sp.]
MRKIFLTSLVISSLLTASAQTTKEERKQAKREKINALIKQEEEGVIAYRKHTIFGIKLTNDGYGAFLDFGRGQSITKALLFQIDFSERKHAKEDKQTNPFIPTTPYIYGKINFFYPLKLGVQQQVLLGNKSNKNGVSVTGNFGGGISLALLRPYMLDVFDTAIGRRRNIKYESADSSLFTDNSRLLNPNDLSVSGPRLGSGWSQMKVTPGLYVKAAVRFDYARFNEVVNGLEVGVNAEYYTKAIPQIVFVEYNRFFANIYVAILFGKRK